MEKWSGKLAVVTGASAGIGADLVRDLAKIGVTVIGLARRPEVIEENARKIGETPGKIHARKCDVSDLQSIKDAFKWIEEKFGIVHILINNAGVLRNIKLLTDDDVSDKITETINTNFAGLVHVTREAYRLMKRSNDYGMIINVNSNAGHKIPFPSNPNISHNVYHGSKFAVTATSEVLRQELICQGNDKIRVTVNIFILMSWWKISSFFSICRASHLASPRPIFSMPEDTLEARPTTTLIYQ